MLLLRLGHLVFLLGPQQRRHEPRDHESLHNSSCTFIF
jgi:hypothetical protein